MTSPRFTSAQVIGTKRLKGSKMPMKNADGWFSSERNQTRSPALRSALPLRRVRPAAVAIPCVETLSYGALGYRTTLKNDLPSVIAEH